MDAFWLCGLIMAVFSGWALSSYASSFSYRLPRGENPFGRKPYCGECNALLEPRDLFPIFSFLLTDGKCRRCGAVIPPSYYVLELMFPVLFVAAYAHFGFGDPFLVVAFAGSALLVLAMMAVEDDYFSGVTLLFIMVLGCFMQALAAGFISDALMGGFLGFIVSAAIERKKASDQAFDIQKLPAYVWMATAIGCWFPVVPAIAAGVGWLILWRLCHAVPALPHRATSAPVIGFVVVMIAAIFLIY